MQHKLINIKTLIQHQQQYVKRTLSLIASENYVSQDILDILGSSLTNKYAEGTYKKRYYSGCKYVNEIEYAAIENAKTLFNVNFVNVQPYSGSIANAAIYLALLNAGDTILGMSLVDGGHFTHGMHYNFSGRFYNTIHYRVNKIDMRLDYEEIERLALQHKPKIIIAGCSAYSRAIDFAKFASIAKKVGAYLMADISHIAGIIAAGRHMNPSNYADVITSTTHKTLCGPRGAIIMTNNEDIAKKINRAVFPGLQGGPLMNVIAAKALCFEKAMQHTFRDYIDRLLENTKQLIFELSQLGCSVIADGSDNHMFLINTVKNFNMSGVEAQDILENLGVLCNKNLVPFDTAPPSETSGIRIGLSAATSRGIKDMRLLAEIIVRSLKERSGANFTRLFRKLLDEGREVVV